jgi:hypothetical protein
MRRNLVILILLLVVFTGCEKIQHPEEISIGKIENYDQLVTAVGGVYGELAKAFNLTLFSGLGFYAANLKGDDLNFGYPYNQVYGCWDIQIYDYPNSYTKNIPVAWQSLYKVIVTANNIITQYKNITQYDERTKKIIGEIFLLRAYCYFRLTRTYGQIPIITDIDINYSVKNASFTDIYNFIENGLKIALDLLPDNNSHARIPYVTPNRGTAQALLAELYLNWAGYPIKDISKYAMAANKAGEVIDSANYFGFGLVDDFAWLWDNEHMYNKESILTLYYANPLTSMDINEVNTFYFGWAYNDNNHDIITSPESYSIDFRFFPTEIKFYNYYPSGYRKDLTFFSTIYDPNLGYIHITSVDECHRVAYRKFFLGGAIVPDSQYLSFESFRSLYLGNSKIYLFRYAQTLLTYAESTARSSQPDDKSYEYLNEIRRRAHHFNPYIPSEFDLQPGLSPEVFADSVVWERAWELAGEPEGRWFDLVRLEIVEDLPDLRHPQEGGPPETFDKSVYFSPIPQGDIELNPNLGE